jgi:hypothetical protein
MYSIEIIQCPQCKQKKRIEFDCNEDLPVPQNFECDKCHYMGNEYEWIFLGNIETKINNITGGK